MAENRDQDVYNKGKTLEKAWYAQDPQKCIEKIYPINPFDLQKKRIWMSWENDTP
jgi:hypothetical protein